MAEPDPLLFYETHYDLIGQWMPLRCDNVVLGGPARRICRFCGKTAPDVTFKKVAHAIPEALGNRGVVSLYECDACNTLFGEGIENDLGNWTKPLRTFARIRGKSGVPTLKRGGDTGWRIEPDDNGFQIKNYEDDPVMVVDHEAKRLHFTLKRDPFTPVAVLKALMKIGLTLMPEAEIGNFAHALAWIRLTDHNIGFAEKAPVFYQFQPGPMPNDRIVALLLRRKSGVEGVPYAFLVLGYGNEVFQVPLPSAAHDQAINGKLVTLSVFPVPGGSDPALYGPPGRKTLDLTGRDIVRGEVVPLTVGFENAIPVEPAA